MPYPPLQRDLFGRRPLMAVARPRMVEASPGERARRALARHGWLLVLSLAASCGAGVLVARWMTPVYSATGSIELQSLAPAVRFAAAAPTDTATSLPDVATQLQTVAEELGSRALVGGVAQTMGPQLARHAWRLGNPPAPGPEELTNAALRQLEIVPVAQSQIIRIRFEAPQPQLAAGFVNRLVAAYLDRAAARSRTQALARVSTLDQRAQAAAARVNVDQDQILTFAAAHGLANPAAAAKLADQRRQQLAAAQTAAEIAGVRQDNAPATAPTPVELATQRATLSATVSRLAAIYQPQAAPLVEARQQLAGLDAALAAWRADNRRAAASALAADQRQARAFTAALERQGAAQRGLSQTLAAFDLQRRSLEADQNAYSGLLDQLQRAVAETGGAPAPVRVLDAATVPDRPLAPNPAATLAYAALLGLMLGGTMLTVWERTHDGIQPAEAQEMGVPLLALLPPRREETCYERGLTAAAAALLQAQTETGVQVVMVAGAEAGAGASTVADGLSCQLALSGARALLIEATAAGGGPGLNELLAGRATVDQVLRHRSADSTGREFDVISGGGEAVCPPALALAGGAGADLLAAARQRYDWVLVDAGALWAGPDPGLWGALADVSLVVTTRGRSSRRRLRHSLELLAAQGTPEIGLILNRAPEARRAAPVTARLTPTSLPAAGAGVTEMRQRA